MIIYKKGSKFACIISLLPWSFSIALIFQYFNSAIWVIRFTPKVLHVNQHKIDTFENIKSTLFWFIRRNLNRKVVSVDTTIYTHIYIMHRLSFHCSDIQLLFITENGNGYKNRNYSVGPISIWKHSAKNRKMKKKIRGKKLKSQSIKTNYKVFSNETVG